MSANCIRLRKWDGIARNAEFVMENLLASRLGSQSKLPWTLTKCFRFLFLEWKTQKVPHFRVTQLRVFTKSAFWNTPLVLERQ